MTAHVRSVVFKCFSLTNKFLLYYTRKLFSGGKKTVLLKTVQKLFKRAKRFTQFVKKNKRQLRFTCDDSVTKHKIYTKLHKTNM